MKKIKYCIGALVFSIFAFISCEDYFEKVPSDLVRAEDFYQTSIDAQIAESGVFTLLQDLAPNLVVIGELMGDLTTMTQNYDEDLYELNTHNLSLTNPYIQTSGFYKVIIAANEVLENLHVIKEKEEDFTEREYNRLVGYIVAVRSWCYLTLVQLHGEAAYISGNITDIDDIVNIEYMPKTNILKQLIVDLDTLAGANDRKYSYDYVGTTDEVNIAQTININAVIGDIYLELEYYDSAAMHYEDSFNEWAKYFVISNSYKEEDWLLMFKNNTFDSNNDEIMFRAFYSKYYGQTSPLEKLLRYDEEYKLKPTQPIVDLFNAQGSKGDEYRGLNVSYGKSEDGDLYINKYSLGTQGNSNIIIYRSGDIALKYAEALNRLGEHENALAVLNEGYLNRNPKAVGIRDRVSLPSVAMPGGSGNELTIAIENLIMDERALELAFEGKRWFDLMRVARRRGDNAYLADKVSAKFEDPTVKANVRNTLMDEKNWLIPYVK